MMLEMVFISVSDRLAHSSDDFTRLQLPSSVTMRTSLRLPHSQTGGSTLENGLRNVTLDTRTSTFSTPTLFQP